MVADLAGVIALFDRYSHLPYDAPGLTHLDHALQAATLAERDGADQSLVCAALLHDVGFMVLMHRPAESPGSTNNEHEEVAAQWLSRLFPPKVIEPIRLHVPAKRYLVAAEPSYLSKLDTASNASLALQGGPMTESEITAFRQNRHFSDAIRLRRWDDQAKVVGAEVIPWSYFKDLINGNCALAVNWASQ
jgi:phosphonate degradation associated HDIG domain protein